MKQQQKRARSSSGAKKGCKKQLFKVTLPQRFVGLPPRHPDTPPPYSVSERDGYVTVWIQIYIYVDKYLAMD